MLKDGVVLAVVLLIVAGGAFLVVDTNSHPTTEHPASRGYASAAGGRLLLNPLL